ncbi:MAG: winged helix-turn-helix domain-containing protein, partial [Sphingomonadaceae bacterium]|nr:winged helix-turn-helix domain-containing protein [Sphingomonadaceae bacterium]
MDIKTTAMPLSISNRAARRLWLDAQGLSATPTGPLDVLGIVEALGFVQLDTIRAVSRAHHHILWSRNQNYREPMLWKLLAKDRAVFEHFTHDASILPMSSYPFWRRQFGRLGEKTARWEANRGMLNAGDRAAILARIEAEGPLASKHFDTRGPKGAMWDRPPHKFALDHMWYAGELATSHRENFSKFYDLAHRVIPEEARAVEHPEGAQIDWLCRNALARLAFGTPGDIKRFWEAATLDEVKIWCEANAAALIDVEIECADRSTVRAL